MKTLLTLLVGAAVGIGAIHIYHKFGPKTGTIYVLELNIKDGQRVELRSRCDVPGFETLLKLADNDGKNGSKVNIKPDRNQPDEVEGPKDAGAFPPVGTPQGPTGSIHNTQKIFTNNVAALEEIVKCLKPQGAENAAAGTESSAPSPMPSP